jgi:cystathionine beta-lyase
MTPTTQAVRSPFSDLRLADLRRRSSAKWQFYPDDVLPLWVAEMDAYVAQPIVDAVHDALTLGDTGYPWGPRLQSAIASFAEDRWDWTFDPARAITVTDVMTGVLESIQRLSNPGDPVVLTPPIYPPFSMVTRMLERPMIAALLTDAGRLDLDHLDAAFATAAASGGKPVMLLSNPHNPTGVVNTREELESLAGLARKHGVRVISDEIHAPLIMPTSTFVPYLSVAGTEPDVSMTSASKGWNLAGFKAAIAIGGADASEDLEAINHRMGTHPGHIAVIAHSTAYNEARPWLDSAIAGINDNRFLLAELLRKHLPAAGYTPPEATYLAWIDCRELGLGDDPAKVFLDLGRVGLSSGVPFGENGPGRVRFNLATAPAIITEAVERMAMAVETYQRSPSAVST